MTGRIAHIAINADDDSTRAFYAAVFDWTFTDWGPPGFSRTEVPTVGPAPIVALQDRRELVSGLRLNAPELTVAVDDLATAERAAIQHGGTIVMAATEIPAVGTLLFAEDPSGNIVGIIEFAS
ncbi:MAG: hypothetical protein JHC95_01675 [Solirubrobacteraceae bacterium]|nr:hypothetical protein [Solirubrobacteraceae bacterium]